MVFYKPVTNEQASKIAKELKFFSTHNHTEVSNFRLRDCIIKIPDLINRSIELGYNGVCCTDHEALSAHVRFIRRYKEIKENKEKYDKLKVDKTEEEIELELNKNENKSIKKNLKYYKNFDGFKIGLGNEIYLVDRPIEDEKISKFFHFILIAKDKKGYEQIKRISSDSAWKNWYRSGIMERVPTYKDELESIIGGEKGHIIAQSACLGSELDNLILEYLNTNDKSIKQKIDAFIKWCIKIFGKENFYLEIQPCVIKQDKDGNNLPHEQAMVNQFMFVLSKAYGLKIICSTDSHYLTKNDAKIHEAYLKADDNEKSRNREVASFYETTYMFSISELVETLSYHLTIDQIKEALINTQRIYDSIEVFDLYHSTIVPTDKKIPPFKVKHIFKDWYDKYEYLKKYAESEDKQDQYLLYLVEQGFEKKKQWGDSSYHFATYDENGKIIEEHDKIVTQEEKIARINEEFSSFWQISERLNQKLSAYYVLVRGLVHEVMWKVSFVGVARGSAGGSYICYLSEITQINPLKYDLPFWRHSSPLRPELPDIDLDSEALKRPLIFQNMHDYYGDENVLNTLTLKTEGTKSTILVCAKGFGINNDDAQHLADLVPFERGSNWSLKDCFYGNEENGRMPVKEFINEVNKYEGLKDTLFKIEGLICGRSIHASASYIFDAGYIVQNSKMRAPNGTTITAYNMEDSDYMGGLKVD